MLVMLMLMLLLLLLLLLLHYDNCEISPSSFRPRRSNSLPSRQVRYHQHDRPPQYDLHISADMQPTLQLHACT
jgi:hypothetical protein